MEFMETVKTIIKWGGIPVGLALNAVGIYFTAKDIATLGLPAWVWYLIGTGVLLASFIAVMVGFYKENKSLRAALAIDSDSRLRELRREYRKPQSSNVTNIPPTLGQMWKVVESVMNEKKSKRVSNRKLLDMMVSLLEVPKDDPILNAENYTTEDKIQKITKRFESKLGLRKSNAKLEAEWRRRIAEEMDSCKIGLQLNEVDEYIDLMKQLNEDRMLITRSRIDNVIDGFIDNLHALYSVRLLLFYGKTEKKLYIFPRKIRNVLRHMEEVVDRAMRGSLRRVNENLEDYSIGKDINE